jgi:hypothetical protein
MTKNRIVFLLMLILSIIFIYFYGGIVPYTLFYLVISIATVSFIYSFILHHSTKCSQSLSSLTAIKGERVVYKYVFSNKSILLNPYLTSNFSKTSMLISELDGIVGFSIKPRGTKQKEYGILCKYRGVYELGICEVFVEDFFGIFKHKIPIDMNFTLTVYPKIIDISNFIPLISTVDDDAETSNTIVRNRRETGDIRNYVYGDPIKSVHWKLSAKLNQLLVKSQQEAGGNMSVVVLDLYSHIYEDPKCTTEMRLAIQDKLIEVLCAITHYLANKKHPACLASDNNDELNFINFSDIPTFQRVYQYCCKVVFDSATETTALLEMLSESNIAATGIFLVTSNLTFDLLEGLVKLTNSVHFMPTSSGYGKSKEHAKILYVVPPFLSKNELAKLDALIKAFRDSEFDVIVFETESDTRRVLEIYASDYKGRY